MGWFTGTIVYLLTWWVVIFAVLPFGVKRDERGMPKEVKLLRAVLITSLISAVIWVILYCVIESDIVSFRDMASAWIEEERPR